MSFVGWIHLTSYSSHLSNSLKLQPSPITEKDNLEKIDDDEDSQAYHLDHDDDDDDLSGPENEPNESELNESELNDSGASPNYEQGTLT